jgi:penicillin-binding protein 1A
MFALQIERVYTKEQILTMYCNQHFLGGGAYGFEAASGYYFRKPLKDLGASPVCAARRAAQGAQQYSPLLASGRRRLSAAISSFKAMARRWFHHRS